MRMLKGPSESVRTQNVHAMMQAGHPERHAVTVAAKQQRVSTGKKRKKKMKKLGAGVKPMPVAKEPVDAEE